MKSEQLTALTGIQLVEMASVDTSLFKAVGAELQRRPLDPDATDALIAAYREGRAPPWFVAYLLGCSRGPGGYDVAREILLAAPRRLAESYAGPAMARIAGVAAYDDLESLMMTAPLLRSREGAAYGLGVLERPTTASAMLRAVQAKCVRRQMAASIVGKLPDAVPLILEWFGSEDETIEALALDAASYAIGNTGDESHTQLACAIRRTLDGGRVKQSPSMRQVLLNRIAPARRSRA